MSPFVLSLLACHGGRGTKKGRETPPLYLKFAGQSLSLLLFECVARMRRKERKRKRGKDGFLFTYSFLFSSGCISIKSLPLINLPHNSPFSHTTFLLHHFPLNSHSSHLILPLPFLFYITTT